MIEVWSRRDIYLGVFQASNDDPKLIPSMKYKFLKKQKAKEKRNQALSLRSTLIFFQKSHFRQ